MRAEKVLNADLYTASDQPIFREKLLVVTLEVAHSEGSPKDPELISKWLNSDSNNPCLEHLWLIEIKIELSRHWTRLAPFSKRFLFASPNCAIRHSTFDADLKPGNPLSIVITIQAISDNMKSPSPDLRQRCYMAENPWRAMNSWSSHLEDVYRLG
jgi:hypothetical protein